MKLLDFNKIKKDGRKIEQIGNRDIYMIKEFLEIEEQVKLYDALENLTTEDFYNSYLEKQIKPQAKQRFGSDDLQQLVKDGIITDIESAFDWY